MREFAKISCSIWSSEKFTSLPDDNARLLYLYLHTCPHVNSLGCYVLRPGYALSDLGWDADPEGAIRYRNGIEALSKASLIGFDKQHNLVRIVDFLKHSPFANPKHAKGALNILDDIPECEEKSRLIKDIEYQKHLPPDFFRHGDDTVSIPYQNSFDIPETRDPRPETNGGGGSARAREPLPSEPTWREQMLGAMGVDPSGLIGANGKVIGQRVDLETAALWERDLGLSRDAILTVIRETIAGKRDGPPASFRYFTRAMEREAGRMAEPPLQPAPPNEVNYDRQPARNRRQDAADEALRRRLDAAARID